MMKDFNMSVVLFVGQIFQLCLFQPGPGDIGRRQACRRVSASVGVGGGKRPRHDEQSPVQSACIRGQSGGTEGSRFVTHR